MPKIATQCCDTDAICRRYIETDTGYGGARPGEPSGLERAIHAPPFVPQSPSRTTPRIITPPHFK